jgi:hypothetical protein
MGLRELQRVQSALKLHRDQSQDRVADLLGGSFRSTEGLKNKVDRSVKLTPRMQLNNFNNQTYRMEMDVMKLRP